MKCFTLILGLLLLTNCKTKTTVIPQDAIPEHDTFTMMSKEIGEDRVINIWTPSSYKSNSESLPVLYMADGGIKEDFPHIANTLADLIKSNKIKPIILVGIENTQRRRDLSGPTLVEEDKKVAPVVGKSENFRNFIKNELFAEINKRYRTTSRKGIIGESLSGLFVTETLFLNPEMFDFYIAFDPSVWWNDQYLIKNAQQNFRKIGDRKIVYWFAGSDIGKRKDSSIKNLLREFQNQSIPNLVWTYSDEPKETHATIFRATKEKAIFWTLNQ